jgi:basic amino acid/polyamine antiporter, APA family
MLKRAIGVRGAVMMGLGSIIGTGVFVSLGLAAGLSGAAMIPALFLAGCLAVCNGLSTAQLAASHPLSGGTYEYGRLYLNPWFGFFAGWLFICAKSASAATAALGLGSYFLRVVPLPNIDPWHLGLVAVVLIVALACFGIKRSNLTNTVIVLVTLLSLSLFVLFSGPSIQWPHFTVTTFAWPSFFEATALLFVAYTGYGRVATLGEEINEPEKNIPRAIIATLGLSFLFYLCVAMVAIGAVGASDFYSFTIHSGAPLEMISRLSGHAGVATALSIGAITAMLGVLLNLVLGLSRVVLAMARQKDLPSSLGRIHAHSGSPVPATIFCGLVIVSLVLIGDIRLTWSFSAFTVLVYYAITNLSALRLPKVKRLYPRFFAWAGLAGCLGLSFWITREALILGGSLLLLGWAWKMIFNRA